MKRTLSAILCLFMLLSAFLALPGCVQGPEKNPPETTDGSSETLPETTEPETSEEITTEPEPVIPPRIKTEAEYTYSLTKADKMYHFYQITATYNGEEHKFQIRVPIVSVYDYEPEEAAAQMNPQIETLNQMAQSSANVRLWVYVATCLEDSELMADIIPTDDLSSNFRYFASQLDPSIWVGHLEPFDIEERNLWYLGTDHHWSTDGWYEAYTEIMTAMHEVCPDISPREGTRVVTDSLYYGSIARENGNLGCPKDTFVYYTFPLDTHTVEIQKDKNGRRLYASEVPFEENIAKYEEGKQNKQENFDHYVNFYPICKKVVFPENQTGRNLLFMGDSFSLGGQGLIASHFDTTYYCYLDGTKDIFKGQDFTAFCKENGITDVIIVEQSTRILYNYYESGPALASFYVGE